MIILSSLLREIDTLNELEMKKNINFLLII